MKPRSMRDLGCLVMSTALVVACGDDAAPIDDDDTTGTTGPVTMTSGVTLTTTVTATTTGLDDTTGGFDDDTTDTGLDDTTDTTDTGLDDTTDTTGDTTDTGLDDTTDTSDEESTGEIACTEPDECPDPGSECLERTCENQVCGTTPVEIGTPTQTQTEGDCQQIQCDGAGGTMSVDDDDDLPDDDNACTEDLCIEGAPQHPALDAGEACDSMGGQVCDGAGLCVECVDHDQCGGGTCIDDACAPNVIATVPDDEATAVPVDTGIVVTFSAPMDPSTLTAQTDAGACTGSIQVSYDGFTSCIGFAAATPAMSDGNTVATLTPAPALAYGVTYELRVTTAAESAGSLALAAQHDSSFTTVAPSDCAGTIVISQVYGGGGNTGAQWTHDFVVLHNTGSVPATLAGWSLQYAAAASSNWASVALYGEMQPGAYYLIRLGGTNNPGDGATIENPDLVANSPNIHATNGKLALVRQVGALSSDCPGNPEIVDFVGYGSANCWEGGAAVAPLGNTLAAHRDVSGCHDADDNATDFATGDPVPNNAASTPAYCSCSLDVTMNETDDPDEADWCILQHPPSLTVDELQDTDFIYGQIYEAGITGGNLAPEGVVAQVGYGRPITDIDELLVRWAWFDAAWNDQFIHDDNSEYMASFPAPAVGTSTQYAYVYRFSVDDGLTWTYCDLDGAGSDATLFFDPDALGIMTVND